VIIDTAAELMPVLQNLCTDRDVEYHRFGEVAKDHFLPTIFNGYAVFEREPAGDKANEDNLPALTKSAY